MSTKPQRARPRRRSLTPEQGREQRRGLIFVLVVAMVAVAFFFTIWLIQLVFYLNAGDDLD